MISVGVASKDRASSLRRGWRVSVSTVALLMIATALVPPRAWAAAAVVDPGRGKQWNLDQIGAEQAWGVATGEGITVAVVDTGAALDHEDLVGQVVGDASCLGASGDPSRCSGRGTDDHGHGTHVAGIVAATTGNGRGVASVAPGARLLVVRALRADPGARSASGSQGDVDAGIRWAVDRGARVVNLSLGEDVVWRNFLKSGLADAVRYAWDRGAVAVVSAGNTNVLFGSGYDDLPVVVVTATRPDGQKASYATEVGSAQWGLAAPGGEGPSDEDGVLSTWWDPDRRDAYAWTQGTSMAAPHVSGALAVLLSRGLSPQQAIDRLLATAFDLGPPGPDRSTGYGRLDIAAAVAGEGTTSGSPALAPGTTTSTDRSGFRDLAVVAGAEEPFSAPGGRGSTDGAGGEVGGEHADRRTGRQDVASPETSPDGRAPTAVSRGAGDPPQSGTEAGVPSAWWGIAAVAAGAALALVRRLRRAWVQQKG